MSLLCIFLREADMVFSPESWRILSHNFLSLCLSFLGYQRLNQLNRKLCLQKQERHFIHTKKKLKFCLSFASHIIWVWWISGDIYQILNGIPLRVPTALQSLSHDLCSQQLKIMTSGTIFHGFHIKWDESAGLALKHLVICRELRVTLNVEMIKFHDL